MASQRISVATERLINERVAAAIADYEASRVNGTAGTSGTGPRPETVVRECTYKEFLSCKPATFTGTEGAVGLMRWIEKMESVFRICCCPENSKVKFSTCTLADSALTWWNAQAQAMGIDAAYALSWEELKRKMNDAYCPRNEVQKLEAEFWDLKVINNDVAKYSNRFLELAILCPSLVTPEYKKVERYIWGLSPPVQGMVTSSKPEGIQEAMQMAHSLNDQFLRHMKTSEDNTSTGKRKGSNYDNPDSSSTPSQHKKQNSGKVTDKMRKTGYTGAKPFCNKCKHHHTGNCASMCDLCRKLDPTADRSQLPTTPGSCYNCGQHGHHIRDCPKPRKMNNRPT